MRRDEEVQGREEEVDLGPTSLHARARLRMRFDLSRHSIETN